MLATLTSFVDELRRAGLPVSLTESLDAAAAISGLPLERKEHLKSALSATLVKSVEHEGLFTTLFEVWFGVASGAADHGLLSDPTGELSSAAAAETATSHGEGGEGLADDEVRELVQSALASNDSEKLRAVARLGVERYGGIEPGRPVGASYYLSRTLRGIDLEAVLEALVESVRNGAVLVGYDSAGAGVSSADRSLAPLSDRLLGEEVARRGARLRRLLEEEILRQLVAERGVETVGRSIKRTLVEDVDFMHATREELLALRRAVYPLTRVLAARLSRRRKHHKRGHLDFRATIRGSMSYGGVPVEPRFRSPHPTKPEIFLLADVSGSVAAFARFTMHLVYALDAQFSKVRSFVFVDGIDEVTSMLASSSSLAEAIERVATEAAVTHRDGHSDYGNALLSFRERWASSIGPRTNVLILGDARSNYHPSEAWVLGELAAKARRLYWLNPEPRSYWGSGDSIASQYEPYCDEMVECRNLRQLESFVEELT